MQYVSLVTLVLFCGSILVTSIEQLLDIFRGVETYSHGFLYCIPWIVATLIGWFTVKYLPTFQLKILFIGSLTIVSYIISTMLEVKKHPAAIPLFFCTLFFLIGIANIQYHDRFISYKKDINKIRTISVVSEKKFKIEVVKKEVEGMHGTIVSGIGALTGLIGICMIILMTVKKYEPLVRGGYPILIAVGGVYAFLMIYFFLLLPIDSLSNQIYKILLEIR